MSRRRLSLTAAGIALAAIALGGAVGLRAGDSGGPSSPAANSAASDAPADSAPRGAESGSGTKQHSTEQDGDEEPGKEQDTGAAGTEAAPPPAGPSSSPSRSSRPAGGVTVVPESAGPASAYALPQPPAPSSSRSDDYDPPAAASAALGRLVAGYPRAILPVAPRSTVVSSSVSPSAERVQVALVARASSAQSVLRFYRTTLSTAGFTEKRVPAVGGATAAAFRRGGDRVVVTLSPGTARTYSIYATLDADRG